MKTHQILILVADTRVLSCVADSLQERHFASISPTNYKDTKASIFRSKVIAIADTPGRHGRCKRKWEHCGNVLVGVETLPYTSTIYRWVSDGATLLSFKLVRLFPGWSFDSCSPVTISTSLPVVNRGRSVFLSSQEPCHIMLFPIGIRPSGVLTYYIYRIGPLSLESQESITLGDYGIFTIGE